MSELIAMRQRIKAIETIKKITHAMRLISMSIHGQLRHRRAYLEEYKQQLMRLIHIIMQTNPTWSHPILWPSKEPEKKLIILVGSQKGLCGTFNLNLFAFFNKHIISLEKTNLIIVGKRAVDYFKGKNHSLIMKFPEFTQRTALSIAEKIADHIWHAQIPYSSVVLFYNNPKTFFAQVPTLLNLIPFSYAYESLESIKEPYRWEQDPITILDILAHKYMQSIIQEALLQSLIAEQAARFIAMDNSTRNASNLLDEMRLNYNKLRQARITRELADLTASL